MTEHLTAMSEKRGPAYDQWRVSMRHWAERFVDELDAGLQ